MEELIPPLPSEILSKIIHFGNRNRFIPLVCQQFRQLSEYEYEYIPNGRDLRQALEKKNVNMINRILRARKFDFEQEILDYCIIKASKNGHLNVVERLLQDKRVNPSYGNYAIRYASMYGHLAVVERLLQDKRVDPTAYNNDAIRCACRYGHLAVIERLLQDKRVNPTAYNNEAIIYASENGHLAVVEILLQDARVDASDKNNEAIRLANRNDHLAVVDRLLQDPRVNSCAVNSFEGWLRDKRLKQHSLSYTDTYMTVCLTGY